MQSYFFGVVDSNTFENDENGGTTYDCSSVEVSNLEDAVELANYLDRYNIPAFVSYGETYDTSDDYFQNNSLRGMLNKMAVDAVKNVLKDF